MGTGCCRATALTHSPPALTLACLPLPLPHTEALCTRSRAFLTRWSLTSPPASGRCVTRLGPRHMPSAPKPARTCPQAQRTEHAGLPLQVNENLSKCLAVTAPMPEDKLRCAPRLGGWGGSWQGCQRLACLTLPGATLRLVLCKPLRPLPTLPTFHSRCWRKLPQSLMWTALTGKPRRQRCCPRLARHWPTPRPSRRCLRPAPRARQSPLAQGWAAAGGGAAGRRRAVRSRPVGRHRVAPPRGRRRAGRDAAAVCG